MIAHLKGHMEHLLDHSLILDVRGVGYQVFCSTKTLQQLGPYGAPVSLWIETIIRPEIFQLFGFLTLAEREGFRLLLTVQGVGTRMALNLLSAFDLEDLARAILAQDKGLLTRAEGVGPKLAARLITELKEKVEKIAPISSFSQEAGTPAIPSVWEEALSALCNLGYGRFEAQKAVDHVRQTKGEEVPLDHAIRHSLSELSRRGAA